MGKLIRRSNVRPRSEYGVRGTTAQLEVLSTQHRVRHTADITRTPSDTLIGSSQIDPGKSVDPHQGTHSTAPFGDGPRHEQPGTLCYSITSSARCSSDCGIVSPSALAVLRLITSSNCVGCSTGISAGLAPLRILSTKLAALRQCHVLDET